MRDGIGASGWGRAVVISTWAKLGDDRVSKPAGSLRISWRHVWSSPLLIPYFRATSVGASSGSNSRPQGRASAPVSKPDAARRGQGPTDAPRALLRPIIGAHSASVTCIGGGNISPMHGFDHTAVPCRTAPPPWRLHSYTDGCLLCCVREDRPSEAGAVFLSTIVGLRSFSRRLRARRYCHPGAIASPQKAATTFATGVRQSPCVVTDTFSVFVPAGATAVMSCPTSSHNRGSGAAELPFQSES